MSSEALGVVLAGGRSSRMGESKASVPLAGRPLVEYPLQVMRTAGLECVVVAKAGTALPALDVPVWTEPDEPSHPLTGIVAALEQAGCAVVVCACDLPFITPAFLVQLAASPERLVVAEGAGRLHPLLGRYDVTLVDPLRAARDAQRPLHEVVGELQGATLAAPEEALFNVNTPAELARAEDLVRSS